MQLIEKRTFDNRLYDLLAVNCLRPGETITGVISVISDDTSVTFGAYAINSVPVTYADGSSYPPGTVIQVHIAGGVVPVGATQMKTTIRARFSTTIDAQVEGVFTLLVRG